MARDLAKFRKATWSEEKLRELDIYDFGSDYSKTYRSKCSCGIEHEVSTQKDECPEYTTYIYIACRCGLSVKLELPVN